MKTRVIELSISGNDEHISLNIDRQSRLLPMGSEEVKIVHESPYPVYTDEISVTPSVGEQVLRTSNHLLKQDITVGAIPYFTTTNPSGGYTAIIGG